MIRALLLLGGAAHAAQDCPCEPCVEGVGMRDNASWGFYRLSDVYAHTLSSYNACFWPRSLACDYSNKRTHLSDLDAFLAAVRRRLARTPEPPPAADEVVWHLRLGDTVDCDDAFEKPCARNAKYVLQRPFFEAVAARLKPRSVITLIYATQHAGCKDAHRTPPERSRAYVSAAIQLLRSRGFEVRERADGEPDADMTYMCRARTLVLAGGGYTRLAGECARAFDAARPATVLGLAAPATDLVELPRAYRNSRRDALDADKARRAAKKQRESRGSPP